MSADEFDPTIERLFAQAPHFSDSAFFEADVAARLHKASRVRSIALSAAGLIGGLIAVRELLGVNFHLGPDGFTAQAGGGGLDSVGSQAGMQGGLAVQSLLERSGLGDAALSAMGSMGGMQMFWATAGVLVALLAAGVVKLSQQI
ncbi:hypothetical protein [Brevundimonas phoenicis]|uniref:hypothetical protein n=1 Tax=unclassified Brevundimonas TaxID=2622653 RepID=UPI0039A02029